MGVIDGAKGKIASMSKAGRCDKQRVPRKNGAKGSGQRAEIGRCWAKEQEMELVGQSQPFPATGGR